MTFLTFIDLFRADNLKIDKNQLAYYTLDNIIIFFRRMALLKNKLLNTVIEPVATGKNKVTVVGVGQVGMACAFSILTDVSFTFRNLNIYKLLNNNLQPKFNFFFSYCRMFRATWCSWM